MKLQSKKDIETNRNNKKRNTNSCELVANKKSSHDCESFFLNIILILRGCRRSPGGISLRAAPASSLSL